MKLRGRTVLLCAVVLQLCLLYPVVFESVKACARSSDNSLILGENERLHYLIGLSLVTLLTIICNITLFVAGLLGFFSWKKSFVLMSLGVHLIFVLPYHLAGIYLYVIASPANMEMNTDLSSTYSDLLNQLKNNTKNLTTKNISQLSNSWKTITGLNQQYCCCGMSGPHDFGSQFSGKGSYNSSLNVSSLVVSCPSHQFYPFKCKEKQFEGCAVRIPRVHRLFILVASGVGLVCGIVSLCISPFLYASFERDRRVARAFSIRKWQDEHRREIMNEKRRQRTRDDGENSTKSSKSKEESSEKINKSKRNGKSTKESQITEEPDNSSSHE